MFIHAKKEELYTRAQILKDLVVPAIGLTVVAPITLAQLALTFFVDVLLLLPKIVNDLTNLILWKIRVCTLYGTVGH